ncbi:MAG: hypothetical protein IIA27_06780 [Gemmatimonadetes bacterium]|nr:hypothetical protein [Gemmatimonadota bacterium]
MTTDVTRRGSIPAAMAWILALSALLFWLPILGSLIAGYVGGSKAGSVGRAVAAVFLPGAIVWIATILLGGLLASIPILGPIFATIAGLGIWAISFMNIVPLLIGAVIGGKLAEK